MPNYYRITDPSDVRDLSDQIAVWTATGNPKANDWAEQPAAPTSDAVWTADAEWVVPAAPTYTAEQHLDQVGLGGSRQPTLLYLRQAGAQSAKLDATEAYLNGILAAFAADPAPKTAAEWGAAPWGFEEVVAEAVQSLQQ